MRKAILITALLLGTVMCLGGKAAIGDSVVDPRDYIDEKYIAEHYEYQGRTVISITDQDGNITYFEAGRRIATYNNEEELITQYNYDGARIVSVEDTVTNLTTIYDHGRPDRVVDEDDVTVQDYMYVWEVDADGDGQVTAAELADLFGLNLGDGDNQGILQGIAETFNRYMDNGKARAGLAFLVNFDQTGNGGDGNAVYATAVILFDENNDQADTIQGFTDPNPQPPAHQDPALTGKIYVSGNGMVYMVVEKITDVDGSRKVESQVWVLTGDQVEALGLADYEGQTITIFGDIYSGVGNERTLEVAGLGYGPFEPTF